MAAYPFLLDIIKDILTVFSVPMQYWQCSVKSLCFSPVFQTHLFKCPHKTLIVRKAKIILTVLNAVAMLRTVFALIFHAP